MFGQPRVYLGGVRLANDAWSRQRVQEMFFYLLTNPRRTTYQIGADLWSDLDPSKVTNNLYVTVSRLRKAIDIPDCVVSEDGRYSILVPQLWVDVHEFQEAIDLAQPAPLCSPKFGNWTVLSACTRVSFWRIFQQLPTIHGSASSGSSIEALVRERLSV